MRGSRHNGSLAVQVDRRHDKQRSDPDADADRPRVARCAISSRLNRATHGQVTISTHHRQREHLQCIITHLNLSLQSIYEPGFVIGALHQAALKILIQLAIPSFTSYFVSVIRAASAALLYRPCIALILFNLTCLLRNITE